MRTEWGAALISSVLANVNRDGEEEPRAFTVYDFAPHIDEPPISLDKAMQEWA